LRPEEKAGLGVVAVVVAEAAAVHHGEVAEAPQVTRHNLMEALVLAVQVVHPDHLVLQVPLQRNLSEQRLKTHLDSVVNPQALDLPPPPPHHQATQSKLGEAVHHHPQVIQSNHMEVQAPVQELVEALMLPQSLLMFHPSLL